MYKRQVRSNILKDFIIIAVCKELSEYIAALLITCAVDWIDDPAHSPKLYGLTSRSLPNIGRRITKIKPEKVFIHNAVDISLLFDLITLEANAIATGPHIQFPAISKSAMGFLIPNIFEKKMLM